MTTEESVIEETRIHPGEEYRPGGTFDLTKRLAWSRLEDEETRRVKYTYFWEEPGTFNHEQMLEKAVKQGAPENHLYLADGTNWIRDVTPSSYLDYNGEYQGFPVNQVPYVRKWEPHLCLMAHHVDQFNEYSIEHRRPDSYKIIPGGVHSAETQIRNQNALQVFRPMIGDALRRLDAWAAIDPEAVLNFGWKEQLPGIQNIIENKVCFVCEHPYSIREFARLHDYSAWRTALDYQQVIDEVTGSVRMRVPSIVRDVEPWTPHATENLAFFGGTMPETGWKQAIRWFDIAVHRYDRLYAARYAATIQDV